MKEINKEYTQLWKDGYNQAFKDFKRICNRIVHQASGDISYGELIIEINKLKDKK